MISKGRIVGETTSFPNDSATFREDKHSGAAAGCKGWGSQPTWRLSPRGVTEHTNHKGLPTAGSPAGASEAWVQFPSWGPLFFRSNMTQLSNRPRVSASGLERVLRCPASAVLPIHAAPSGVYADRGTAIHAFLERFGEGIDKALEGIDPKYHAECRGIDLQAVTDIWKELAAGAGPMLPEQSLAYNPLTKQARAIAGYEDRLPSEYVGTADLVGPGFVLDYKTGWKPEHANESTQLQFLALCVHLLQGIDTVATAIVSIRDDGTVTRTIHRYDVFDFAEMTTQLETVHGRIQELRTMQASGETLPVTPGAHCKYCKSRQHCPEQVAIVKTVPGQDALATRLIEQLRKPKFDNAEVVLQGADMLTAMAKSLRDRAYAQAQEDGSIPSPAGPYKIRRGRGQTRLDGRLAYEALAARVGENVASKHVDIKVSQKAIKEAAKAAGMPQKPMVDAILEELANTGGLSKTKGQEKLVLVAEETDAA